LALFCGVTAGVAAQVLILIQEDLETALAILVVSWLTLQCITRLVCQIETQGVPMTLVFLVLIVQTAVLAVMVLFQIL
jgi:hypothetical protein